MMKALKWVAVYGFITVVVLLIIAAAAFAQTSSNSVVYSSQGIVLCNSNPCVPSDYKVDAIIVLTKGRDPALIRDIYSESCKTLKNIMETSPSVTKVNCEKQP